MIIIIIVMIEFVIFAGNIFDVNTTIDDEIIKSSRYNEIEACVFFFLLEFTYAVSEANLF